MNRRQRTSACENKNRIIRGGHIRVAHVRTDSSGLRRRALPQLAIRCRVLYSSRDRRRKERPHMSTRRKRRLATGIYEDAHGIAIRVYNADGKAIEPERHPHGTDLKYLKKRRKELQGEHANARTPSPV